MVSKCANPDCSATFRYFHVGKLFRTESSSRPDRRRSMGEDEEASGRRPRRVEFHWLCESCASKMTLVFDQDAGVSVRQNSRAASAAA